ncbi:MAG: hypothetical protein KAR31_10740, partial [Candidatus Omnitrophica bacterium]|nr:hypothetical protein [Candidatus Omnitrophota bacterium]
TATGTLPDEESSGVTVNSITRAFNTLDDAVDAADDTGDRAEDSNHLNTDNLVTGNYILNIPCYGDGADTTEADIDGWTTGASNYIKVYTPTSLSEVGTTQRHVGKWDADAYKLVLTSGNASILDVLANHTVIEGVQFDKTSTTGYCALVYIQADSVIINRCIVRKTGSSSDSHGIRFGSSTNDCVAKNSIVYGWNDIVSNGSRGIYLHGATVDGSSKAYNCTVYDCYKGIEGPYHRASVSNCAVFGNTYDFNDDFWSITNCASDDKDGDNFVDISPGAVEADDWADAFEAYTTGDFHLKTGSVCKNAGTDLYTAGDVTWRDDIDGDMRPVSPGEWDIGADETDPDTTVPTIDDATLYDTDNDGYIDEIWVDFSEVMDDASVTDNDDAGRFTFGGTAATGVDSVTVSGSGNTTDGGDPDSANDANITIFTDDTSVFGTGISAVEFTAATDKFEDLSANDTATTTTITEIDLAKPVLVDVFMSDVSSNGIFNESGDRMDLVFSETLSALPTEPQLEAALTFAGGATDGDNIPNNIASEGTYTLATTTFTNDTIRIISAAGTNTVTNLSTPGTTTVEVVAGTNIKDDATTPNEANTSATAETSQAISSDTEISLHIGDNRVNVTLTGRSGSQDAWV